MRRESVEKYKHLQDIIQREINSYAIKPMSFEIYKKSDKEKLILSTIKLNHKNHLKAYGYDPKKVMNVLTDKEGNIIRYSK